MLRACCALAARRRLQTSRRSGPVNRIKVQRGGANSVSAPRGCRTFCLLSWTRLLRGLPSWLVDPPTDASGERVQPLKPPPSLTTVVTDDELGGVGDKRRCGHPGRTRKLSVRPWRCGCCSWRAASTDLLPRAVAGFGWIFVGIIFTLLDCNGGRTVTVLHAAAPPCADSTSAPADIA